MNSLLLVGLTHAMFNRSNNSDGIAADLLPSGESRQLAALLATVVWAVAHGLRSEPSRSYRASSTNRAPEFLTPGAP